MGQARNKLIGLKGRGNRQKQLNERYGRQVIECFLNGMDKYQIANKLRITVGDVIRLEQFNKEECKKAKEMYEASKAAMAAKPEEEKPEKEPETIVETPEAVEETSVVEAPVVMLDDIKFVGSTTKSNKTRKITDEIAAQVLADLRENVLSQKDIAKMYDISQSLVSAIKCGRGRFKLIDMAAKPEEEKLETEVYDTEKEKVEEPEVKVSEPVKEEDIPDPMIPVKPKKCKEDNSMPTLEDLMGVSQDAFTEDTSEEDVDTQEAVEEEPKPDKPKLTKKQKKRLKMQQEAEANVVPIDDTLMTVPAVPQGEIPEPGSEEDKKLQAAIREAENLIKAEAIINRRLPVTHYLICGMIANRHDLPTNTFIFNDVPGHLMSNYTLQYDLAINRLKELTEMQDDGGRRYDGIFMYVTGLTTVLASIIKAVLDLQLNMVLMQYNPVDGEYHHQVMFSSFGHGEINPCPPELESSYNCPIYTYDCTTNDFIMTKNGYEVVEYISGTDKRKEVTIFTNKMKAVEFYTALCDSRPDSSIVFNNIYIGPKGKLYVDRTLRRLTGSKYIY